MSRFSENRLKLSTFKLNALLDITLAINDNVSTSELIRRYEKLLTDDLDIGKVIVRIAHERGFSVVREYVGHGIGRKFHQEPTISHVPTQEGHRERLRPGVSFTIEPMINIGVPEGIQDRNDGWTVRTRDGKLSAQFEHTSLMTHNGPEILTLTKNGPQRGHSF